MFMGVESFENGILIHHFVVPLPLPWGRLGFNCDEHLSVANCYQKHYISTNFRHCSLCVSPPQGRGGGTAHGGG